MQWENHATWNTDVWVMFEDRKRGIWSRHGKFDAQSAEKLVRHIWPVKLPGLKEWETFEDINFDQLADIWNLRKRGV